MDIQAGLAGGLLTQKRRRVAKIEVKSAHGQGQTPEDLDQVTMGGTS
jgi:hypothetical protein